MNKPDLERCYRLLDEGFSLLTVGENKQPNIKWKELQNTPLTKEQFTSTYNRLETQGVGIITGYQHLECIDVDLKVFSTAQERKDFWHEYYSLLNDNILDFDKKFVIYRTKNEGYHILYKSKRVVANTKIASLKGHKEAVIESRGLKGYVFIYDGNNQTGLTYHNIDFISDKDREVLWECSRLYNYVEPVKIEVPKKVQKSFSSGLTPWDDYNQRNNVIDVVSGELEIIRELSDKYVVKRFGSESATSGYIFKDNGCLFLHSTGTIYEAEKQIRPSDAYTTKYHNGDYSEAAKELYKLGYGDRVKVEMPIKEKVKINKNELEFPIEIFPEDVQQYILLNKEILGFSVDYMACAYLWVWSIIIGNSCRIKVKTNWTESANLWMMLVGGAGVGKTPSINAITYPIMKMNSKEIKQFQKDKAKYDAFNAESKKEQEYMERVQKPVKRQFIVNDITLEALVDLHEESKKGVGVLRDELGGWVKDMNKYRQGSDLEHWLSSWSGKEINLNRKTAKSSFVEKAFIPVMGGIQPSVLGSFYTEENKANGFIDRILFSYPKLKVEKYNENELDESLIEWYEGHISGACNYFNSIIQYNTEREIDPIDIKMNLNAKKEWIRIYNDITENQNSNEENEYMKSMLPKQKSYIPRFILILHSIWSIVDGTPVENLIMSDSVLQAEKLSKYFIAMGKKIKADSIETADVKKVVSKDNLNTKDKLKTILQSNPDISKTKLAEMLEVSRTQVYRIVKELEDE